MAKFSAIYMAAAGLLVACSPETDSSNFEASKCESGGCGEVDFDALQKTLQICRYEVELAGMPRETAFPVIAMAPFHSDKFCGWEGKVLRYAVQHDGPCPEKQDFQKQLNISTRGPIAARLVKSAKAIPTTLEDVSASNEVRCTGLAFALDNATNRSDAENFGLFQRSESFTIEGDVLQTFRLEWELSELRGLNGLPITAAFYSVDHVTIFWRSRDYPFEIDACEEARQRLIEHGAIIGDAECVLAE